MLGQSIPSGGGIEDGEQVLTILANHPALPDPGATNGVIDLDGFFGLHPSLSPLKELWDDQALAVVVDFHLKGRKGMTAAQLTQFQSTLTALYNGSTFVDLEGTQTFQAVAQLAKANPGQYQPENGAQYPTSDFGKGLLQVAQIIKAGWIRVLPV